MHPIQFQCVYLYYKFPKTKILIAIIIELETKNYSIMAIFGTVLWSFLYIFVGNIQWEQ